MYLLNVRVAPMNSELDGAALVVLPNGPIMVSRKQASGEEIIVMWIHKQSHRVTRQNVLLANGPCRPFYVNLVSASQDSCITHLLHAKGSSKRVYVLITCGGIGLPSLTACNLPLIPGPSPTMNTPRYST